MSRSFACLPLVILLVVSAAREGLSQSTPVESSGGSGMATPRLQAAPLAGEIELDGVLSEAVWERAPVATGFMQRDPHPGAPATERTEVRVLYGEKAIYVGARLYDHPDSIAAQLTRRDEPGSYSDQFVVAFDTYDDNRTAFVFGTNPRGVQTDVRISNDTRSDLSWGAVWEVKTRVDSLGWTAEFRIPLSQLRYAPERSTWGAQFQRVIARRNERVFWAPTPPDAPGIVSRFGTLEGLLELAAPRRLEVAPYAVSRLTRAPGSPENPFYSPNDLSAALGADFQYGLTADLILTGTVNPDFGQVEADPAVVNLSAFEIRFPERRPFFVEGADIFDFGLGGGGELFYSRRIGASPHGFTPSGAVFREIPERTTIYGAAKLSGKTAGGWSIGVLDAVTAPEEARYTTSEGFERHALVEPLTNYGVARVIKDFRDGKSALGGIFTATNRDLTDERLGFLRSAAYTGGLDARHRFGGGNYEVSGSLVGSHIRGSEEAIRFVQLQPGHYFQRPGAEHLDVDPNRTTLSGWAGQWSIRKIGGGKWGWGFFGHATSPGFEVDDLGFQRLADEVYGRAYVTYSQYEPTDLFRRAGIGVHAFQGTTFGGERTESGFNTNGHMQFHNQWTAFLDVTPTLQTLSTTELRGGPALVDPAGLSVGGGFRTDPRAPWGGRLFLRASTDAAGTRSLSLSPYLELRPSPRMELSLGPSLSWNLDPAQYVDQQVVSGDTWYFFGRLDQTTTALTARVSYTFTPDLSLQLYAQPFISAGAFDRFKVVTDPKAEDFDARFHTFTEEEIAFDPESGRYRADVVGNGAFTADFRNPAFNVKSFRSNAVLRWEYRPGSTVFLVWNAGLRDFRRDGSFDLDRDVERLFGAEDTNVLLLKVSYWLGL